MFVSKILIRLLQIVILIWIIIYFDSIFVLGRAVPVPGKKSSTGGLVFRIVQKNENFFIFSYLNYRI